MKKVILKIEGMTCSACSSGIEKYVSKQKGILSIDVNLILATASIEYEGISIKDIEGYIEDAGYKSGGIFKGIEDEDNNNSKKWLIIMGIGIIALVYLSMGKMLGLGELPILNTSNPELFGTVVCLIAICFLIYGFDILKSGIKNLIHKTPNMDSLVTLGVMFSFCFSLYGLLKVYLGNYGELSNLYFDSVCMIIYFIKLGRYLENITKNQTKSAIKQLVQITPKQARIKKGDEEILVSIDEVKIGDILICKPGEKIAVDGVIVKGEGHFDESFITGESKSYNKKIGDKVLAGSVNYDGYIEYKAERIGKNSTISEIVNIVVETSNTKSKIQRIADKISGYFVPCIITIAIISFIVRLLCGAGLKTSLIYMVTVLVVACPCALGLAVPLVSVVANGRYAQKGIFIRNYNVLEKIKNIDVIVFDKTGTLTVGKPSIFKIYNWSNLSDKDLLNNVANLENQSSHPLAKAFNITKKLDVKNFINIPGYGIYGKVEGEEYFLVNETYLDKLGIKNKYTSELKQLIDEGCSIVFIVNNGKIIGLVGIKDIVRKDAKQAISKFKELGIKTIMLSGDNEKIAKSVGDELGIDEVYSKVLPAEKGNKIKSLVDEGLNVIMVGDGINDAPALMQATVGIGINEGTDVAKDTSDVILMNNNLLNIVDLLSINKKANSIIRQNLFWAFFYNIAMIPIAAGALSGLGINMSPIFGAIAMVISSITVILNSLRLKLGKK